MVERNTGQVRVVGPMEEWVKLPKLKQTRTTGPAKISLTVFGYSRQGMESTTIPNDTAGPKTAEPALLEPNITGDGISDASNVPDMDDTMNLPPSISIHEFKP